MVHLCGNYDQVENWINWWNIRKYNISPAFQWFGHSSMNLAETGNLSYKWGLSNYPLLVQDVIISSK